jgi:hypothetical protein
MALLGLVSTIRLHDMSTGLILIVMVIYGSIGVLEFNKGNYPFALMWFGYSISNIALAWMSFKQGLA